MNTHVALLKLRHVTRRRHLAVATEQSYVYWLARFMRALPAMPPLLSSEQKLERFLTQLAAQGDIGASTQHQAFHAILFFYHHVLQRPLQNVAALRISRPAKTRNAPSPADTLGLLQTVTDVAAYPTRLIVHLLYGCGLRVTEPLNLRIKDIQLRPMRLCIRGAKGGKDRFVALPRSLLPDVQHQIERAHARWRADCQNQLPVALPSRLDRKYPEFQFAWPWAWFVPAHRPCPHPHSGHLVRFRMHEVNVQRAVKIARRKLGLAVLPHELRHGYATHALHQGADPRAIQLAMGHNSLETTMGYLHSEALAVPSPLDHLLAQDPGLNL